MLMNIQNIKLQGLSKEEFYEHIKNGLISVRHSRLIPFDRAGDEMALTSVFLSALRLVREFRKEIFSNLKIPQGGEVLYFSEVSFKDCPDCRLDGAVLVFKAGKIVDVAVFEMKNGNNPLDKMQIEKYAELCKSLKIEKLVTVSNQFVSDISYCPVGVKSLKNFSRFHLSWTYILTVAHILLFKNEVAIQDEDQIEIMREVLEYLENKKSGVVGFNYMKKGWTLFSEQVVSGATLKLNSLEVEETVASWIQEEQDLALFLSRSLGVLVDTRNQKYKDSKQKQEELKRILVNDKQLYFNFKIKNVISDIKTMAYFDKRAIEFQVSIPVGVGSSRSKISWLKKQLDGCSKKNDSFDNITANIYIDLLFRNSSKVERLKYNSLAGIQNEYNDREIREFKVLINRDYGKLFLSPGKFIENLEKDSLEFYDLIVQHLKKWQEKAPTAKNEAVAYNGMNNEIYLNEGASPSLGNTGTQDIAVGIIEENKDS